MFFKNRQTATDLGTGLPFLSKKEYQQRYQDITTSEINGYWEIPNNKLPTFQVWTDFDITAVQIIPVDGLDDGTPIIIPTSQLVTKCTTAPLSKIINYTTDDERSFTLDCGLYYIFLEVDGGVKPPLYSEVFLVGGVCAIGFGLDYVITQINVDLSADITFTINPDYATAYAATVNGTPYATRSFSDTLPVGDNTVNIEVSTEYCGTYLQNYIFRNTAGVITVIKQY
jgi:hypothetical protein